MQWDISDHGDWRVVAHTRWLNIQNYQNLQGRAGVYIFADVNHQVKYIGKAGAGRMVSEIHDALGRDKGRGATLVKGLYTNSNANAQSLETALIDKYHPPNNLA
jgi:excinuclease UvrABC nuclease subunit